MELIEQYLQRSHQIIGDRTPEEKQYDNEVVKWLKKYGKIRKALNKANEIYPGEALHCTEENIDDLAAHYDYLLQHAEIVRKIGH